MHVHVGAWLCRSGPEGLPRLLAAFKALEKGGGDRSQGYQGGDSLAGAEGLPPLQPPLAPTAAPPPPLRSGSGRLREVLYAARHPF